MLKGSVCLLLGLSLTLGAQAGRNQRYKVRVVGTVMHEGQPLVNANIRVEREGKTISTHFSTDEFGEVELYLPFNDRYTLTVESEGMIKKIIAFDAHVPGGLKRTPDYDFEISLYDDLGGVDLTHFEEPCAKVKYNVHVWASNT